MISAATARAAAASTSPLLATPPVAWRDRTTFSDSVSLGAAAWPLRSSGTKAALRRRRASMPSRPTGAPSMRTAPGRPATHLARHGGEELGLAVARHARDADDLAAAHGKRDIAAARRRAVRPARGTGSSARSARARAGARRGADLHDFAAHHEAGERATRSPRADRRRPRPCRRAARWRAGTGASPPRGGG